MLAVIGTHLEPAEMEKVKQILPKICRRSGRLGGRHSLKRGLWLSLE